MLKNTLGIEIGERYIKIASVGPRGKVYDYAAGTADSFGEEQMAKVLSEMLRRHKLKPQSVVLCLPRNLATIRNLHLPSKDQSEINQMIELNIARIVPYKKEEIVFGYHFLGEDEMGYTKVMLAIVHANSIKRLFKILEKAGLFIDAISLGSYGAWQWVASHHRQELQEKELYLILDVDAAFTDFMVLSAANLLFTRSISIGSEGIQADPANGVIKLVGEIRQSLVIFYNEEVNKKPVKVFVSGAELSAEALTTISAELGGIPLTAVKPPYAAEAYLPQRAQGFGGVSFSGVHELALEDLPNRIYFMLPEIQVRRSIKERSRDLVVLGALCIYFFGVVCALFLDTMYIRQAYLKRLTHQSEAVEKDVSDLVSRSAQVKFVKKLLAERRGPSVALYHLYRIIPDEISISYFGFSEEAAVTLRGQASELSDVFKFISALEKSKYFSNVQAKYTRKKKVKDKEVTDFELTLSLTI